MMSRRFGSRRRKRKEKRLLEQLLLLMSVVRHRGGATNETEMKRKNRRKEKSNTSEELRRNRATVNDADRVLERWREIKNEDERRQKAWVWWCREQKNSSIYGEPPAGCWSTDRSYRVCSTVLPSLSPSSSDHRPLLFLAESP